MFATSIDLSVRWFIALANPLGQTVTSATFLIGPRQFCLILASIVGFGIASGTRTLVGQSPNFRTVRGKHIVLKADAGSPESLREMAATFDAAVIQWEQFLQLSPGKLDHWRVDGFVMTDPSAFRKSGDLPSDLQFPYGYAMPNRIWVVRQKSDYYTRHLLLHEGVHALAIDQFGGTGPSWFAEGLAEMLGVHRGTGDQVQVNVVPASRDVVPYWGRFKLLATRRSENRIPALDAVLNYPLELNGDVESYGWSWVAMMLMTQYPEYRPAILTAARNGSDHGTTFVRSFKKPLLPQWPIIQARWRLLAHTIDYGFDWSRERVDLSMQDKLWMGQRIETEIRSDQGWQSIGVRFAPGMRVKLLADGQCTLEDQPKPWVSQPAGITIHYANDRPLGQLLVCVLPNASKESDRLEPLRVLDVSGTPEIVIDQHCWLLFRVNDYLGGIGNNRGKYAVQINR